MDGSCSDRVSRTAKLAGGGDKKAGVYPPLLGRLDNAIAPPAVKETAIWIRNNLPWWLNSRRLNGRQTEYIPVFAIRHTHRTVNAGLAFGNQGNTQELLFIFEPISRASPWEICAECSKDNKEEPRKEATKAESFTEIDERPDAHFYV